MVHLERIPGQIGHMIIQEDGTVLSSSGDLASSEATSQHIIGLVSNAFSANFAAAPPANGNGDCAGDEPREGANVNGIRGAAANGNTEVNKTFKWNRVTVSFGEKSYVACLSNRRIHVTKRDNSIPIPTA